MRRLCSRVLLNRQALCTPALRLSSARHLSLTPVTRAIALPRTHTRPNSLMCARHFHTSNRPQRLAPVDGAEVVVDAAHAVAGGVKTVVSVAGHVLDGVASLPLEWMFDYVESGDAAKGGSGEISCGCG
jgi:hypothetical protein